MKRKFILLFSFVLLISITSFAQTPVPNGDFEDWTDTITVQNWSTNNYDIGGILFYTFVHRSADAHGGTYAAKIETINIPVLGDMGGIVTLGSYDMLTGISGGIPISGKPLSLEGYLKYSPVNSDTMAIIVLMTKWNGGSRDTLFYNGIMAFSAIPSYNVFDIPITYNPPSSSPDTVNIIAVSSAGYAPQVGSTLYIDDLTFIYAAGVDEYAGENTISVFPNPTSGFVNILLDGNDNTVNVYNIIGEEIFSRQTSLKNLNIDLSEFPAGVYMLEVTNGYMKHFQKIIVSR